LIEELNASVCLNPKIVNENTRTFEKILNYPLYNVSSMVDFGFRQGVCLAVGVLKATQDPVYRGLDQTLARFITSDIPKY
jgi:hypothetical protein